MTARPVTMFKLTALHGSVTEQAYIISHFAVHGVQLQLMATEELHVAGLPGHNAFH